MSELEQRVARVLDPEAWDDALWSTTRASVLEMHDRRQESCKDAQASLKAHAKWLAEQGLVVVPKAITAEMLRVGMNGPNSAWVFVEPDNLSRHWEAMISAAHQEKE